METASTEIRAKKEKKTEAQLRTEQIERMYVNQTDRNLLEQQTFLIQKSTQNIVTIRKNVQFFFWITIIGMLVWGVVILMAGAPYKI